MRTPYQRPIYFSKRLGMTPEERLWITIQSLSEKQKADCLEAIVAGMLWKKTIKGKDEEKVFTRNMVYVITQILWNRL